ncbi:uncharacterized protein LOC109594673 [Aethina tumida]|uniref:uncharacterized protein LOC109594673 n=1 Tax=Aethina tumida TaxID=116153 RepID=UPI00096B5E3D|nr:uncharacterized protein LOC109594673 [Aethina tumida]
MDLKNILVLALLLVIVTEVTNGLECYECNSKDSNCDNTENLPNNICDSTATGNATCYTITVINDNRIDTLRGCQVIEKNVAQPCEKLKELKGVNNLGICDLCNTDNCNSKSTNTLRGGNNLNCYDCDQKDANCNNIEDAPTEITTTHCQSTPTANATCYTLSVVNGNRTDAYRGCQVIETTTVKEPCDYLKQQSGVNLNVTSCDVCYTDNCNAKTVPSGNADFKAGVFSLVLSIICVTFLKM